MTNRKSGPAVALAVGLRHVAGHNFGNVLLALVAGSGISSMLQCFKIYMYVIDILLYISSYTF